MRATAATLHSLLLAGVGLCPAPELRAGEAAAVEPVVHYDFEQVAEGLAPDGAGTDAAGQRQFSNARLRVSKGGQPWTAASLAPGVRGRGLRFGGPEAKQYLQLDLASSINLYSDDFTILFWLKTRAPRGALLMSTTTPPYWLVSLVESNGRTGVKLALNSGDGRATICKTFLTEGPDPGDGQWRHYALAVDRGRTCRLYLDARLVGELAVNEHRGDLKNVLTVGGPYWFIEGTMDELRIFQGGLAGATVQALFAADRQEMRGDQGGTGTAAGDR